jgi:hypothetical protein
MAWDASRPVPWSRLTREWVVYVAVMGLVFGGLAAAGVIEVSLGAVAGLLISGPLYLLLGAVLAKLGYQRKTLRELRAESAVGDTTREGAARAAVPASRPRPAPTRRTSTGRSQHPRRTTRQRRR